MRRSRFHLLLHLPALAGLLLAGCSTHSMPDALPAVQGASGAVHGGQQPISGVNIQLYAVGTSGDGSPATPLLTTSVVTDGNGYFNITGLYTCPSASTLVYIVGTGGSPAPGLTNPQIALMAAIGPCSTLTPSTFININELTTVAAVYSLAPFLSSYSAVGSGPSDASALTSAFITAGYFANINTGTTPGATVPPGYSVPVAQIDTIADLLAACINSAGGAAGSGTICGAFFHLVQPSGGPAPTDAIGALLDLANNPTANTAALYNLIPAASPFQPTQPIVPVDFALRLTAPSAFTVAPSSLTFASTTLGSSQPAQSVTVTNGTSGPISIGSAQITGVDAADFTSAFGAGSDCSAIVPANSSCTIDVTFTPTGSGSRAAYLVLANSSPNPSIAIALAGNATPGNTGPILLSSNVLYFDTAYTANSVVLTNTGATAVNFSSFTFSASGFSQSNTCGSSLAPAASCLLTVTPQKGTTPASTSTLTLADDAVNGPQTVTLLFNSNPAYTPEFDFGHYSVGRYGSSSLYIPGQSVGGTFTFTLSGPNANEFSFANNSSVLSTTCTFTRFANYCNQFVYFIPSSLGTAIGYFTVQGGGVTTAPQAALFGEGDPAGVDFDFFAYGGASAQHLNTLALPSAAIGSSTTAQFQVTSTGTVSGITYQPPVLSGPNAADFSVTSASGVYTVTFKASSAGNELAFLSETDSTGTVTRTLALTATGTTPVPVLTSSDSLFFSGIPIGTTSPPQSITVQAYQNHPIQATITPTYSGGSQPFVFVGPSSCAATPCTLKIAYSPQSSADSSATVYVVATDTVGNVSGNIQAQGQVATYALVRPNPTSLSFPATVDGTSSAAQPVTLTNIGSVPLQLSFGLLDSPTLFKLSNNCPPTLAVNASCTLNVTFAPTGTGAGTVYDTVAIYGGADTQYVDLTAQQVSH